MAEDPNNVVTHYAFYDIDKNGTKELFTATNTDDEFFARAAYYLKDGVSTYLADAETANARRASFQINEDGTISQTEISSGTGNGTTSIYRLRSDNTGVDLVKEIAIQQLEPAEKYPASEHPVDLKGLDWKPLSSAQSQTKSSDESTSVSTKSELDLEAIAQGDLSSLKGTYHGINGSNTFTFHGDHTITITSDNAEWDVEVTNFRKENGAAVFESTSGPERFYVVPAGVESTQAYPEADGNRDRVYVPHNAFYLD